jgi:hypothetical protein
MTADGSTPGSDRTPGHGTSTSDLYRPFRSRRGRRVAVIIGLAQFVLLAAIALSLPKPFTWVEKGQVLFVAAAVAAVLWRLGEVRAFPSASGLVVHNLIRTTRLEWAQVIAVRLGGGSPWVTLDLDDGDTLAVMAIQRADGEVGQKEAQRLATLVALHSRTARDD